LYDVRRMMRELGEALSQVAPLEMRQAVVAHLGAQDGSDR
jgi:hypothetical protein